MPGLFHVRTFGCQMNQRDAEHMANLLHHADYRPTDQLEAADVVLIHTCSVREKAEHKLYTELGLMALEKRARPSLVVGVGGCVAQQEGGRLLERFAGVDFVFGPQNLRHLPTMIGEARQRVRSLRVDYEDDAAARFELPDRHPEYTPPTPGRAFVTVMEGCDLFCSFCIVPVTRGREVSRPSAAILEEVRKLADQGVIEVTLLGQTVNAYGRPRPGRAKGEVAFAELLARVAEVPGIRRIRFTSPHPVFVGDDLIEAYAKLPALCPHLHLPVQSGSSRVLRAMNRRYDRERYVEIAAALRRARPELALTTDLIVGFPTETRAEFEETLSLVEEVGFVDSFTFKYSARRDTPAERRGLEPVDPAEAQARIEELQGLQKRLTFAAHRARVGQRVEVLVEGPSRWGAPQQLGRCPRNRVVNFTSETPLAPGSLAQVDITAASPHSLLGSIASGPATQTLPLL
jgi:tRNA-2-methylthio-N6-dimethylallyladenosine synthase